MKYNDNKSKWFDGVTSLEWIGVARNPNWNVFSGLVSISWFEGQHYSRLFVQAVS